MTQSQDVNIIITRQTTVPTRAGFGLMLILSTAGEIAYATCAEPTDVVAAGFGTTTDVYKAAQAAFSQSPRPARVAVAGIAGVDIETELNTLIDEHSDWYFLICPTDQGAATIAALSAWIEANKKLYIVRPDEDVAATIALAGSLAGNERTIFMFHDDDDSYVNNNVIDAGLAGKVAPYLPGEITWKFKTISGFTAAGVTTTQLNALDAANVNTYVEKFGVLQTSEGKVLSGEFADVIRSQDFIEARLAEGIAALFANLLKVPYSVDGLTLMEGVVTDVMSLGGRQGIIRLDVVGNPEFIVEVPDIDDIPESDIAARHLPDIYFEFNLAGAVHTATVRGVIRV